MRIEESLKIGVGNRIDFANFILKNEKEIKFEQIVYYILRIYKKMGFLDILIDISEYFTHVAGSG